ncbi:biotin transporter BioY [Xanthobacter oligotrophicus]|uniref:biotin transporter BioY n=1 Tax=Xanthobacter oligotrophicus TaxID=2607286 RepID=UPI0011F3F5A3|nr:biotin transporter BioY [Xanthobacter oligotrophicus]MCG5234979.1 biotin transporter BioY [Xanthobacter oligotrophicus]
MDTRTLVRIALIAALIAALGFVPPIYMPLAAGVPITAQSLGVMLAGLLLGARAGAAAVALFVFVVLLGAPLLAGGRGGLGILAGPTAGFLIGYIAGAYVVGFLAERLKLPALASALVASVVGGILVVYLFGIPVLAAAAGIGLSKAVIGAAVFLPGDLVKAVGAAVLVTTVLRNWSVAAQPRP